MNQHLYSMQTLKLKLKSRVAKENIEVSMKENNEKILMETHADKEYEFQFEFFFFFFILQDILTVKINAIKIEINNQMLTI